MEIISLDAHKRYSQACVQQQDGQILCEGRINHGQGQIWQFLSTREAGSAVAVETVGNWYWIVDEIERAGMQPKLVHAHKAKLMLGSINKTDKLDARGLNRLQRTGTLPVVWIPPSKIRDQRELPRTRMVFANLRTRLKNRIRGDLHILFPEYAKCFDDYYDKVHVELKPTILENFGQDLFDFASNLVTIWRKAAKEHKVGRGLFIAQK